MRTNGRRQPDRGPWEALRPLRQRLRAQQNHPYYVARGNEGPLLEQLVADDPPAGGMDAYIADLNQKRGPL